MPSRVKKTNHKHKTRILKKKRYYEVPATKRRTGTVSNIRHHGENNTMDNRPLEKNLQVKILNDLRSRSDCTCFKIIKASDYGVPDIFFTTLISGAVLIECKRSGEIPDPRQRKMKENLIRNGTKAFTCDSWEYWMKIKKILGIHVIQNSNM